MEKSIHDISLEREWVTLNNSSSTQNNHSMFDNYSELEIINSKKISERELFENRFVVMYGEPSSGKTYSIKQEYERNESTNKSLFIDLKAISVFEEISKKIEQFISELSVNGTIFIDSFDEVMDSISNIRNRLPSYIEDLLLKNPLLSIRLACRVNESPLRFSDEFKVNCKNYGINDFEYEICPISKNELRKLLECYEVPSGNFIKEIEQNGAYSFCRHPLFAIKVVEYYKHKGGFPKTISALYNDFISKLLCEYNDNRNSERHLQSQYDLGTKLKIVQKIASIIQLSKKRLISKKDSDFEENTISVAELARIIGENYKIVCECLNSPLFCAITSSSFTFSHKSYAEYLCADFLNTHNDDTDKIIQLMTINLGNTQILSSSQENVATFLMSINNSVAKKFINISVLPILKTDKSIIEEIGTKVIFNKLKEQIENGIIEVKNDLINNLHKLNGSQITEEIKTIIENKDSYYNTSSLCFWIINECGIKELESLCVDLVNNKNYGYMRNYALMSIEEFVSRAEIEEIITNLNAEEESSVKIRLLKKILLICTKKSFFTVPEIATFIKDNLQILRLHLVDQNFWDFIPANQLIDLLPILDSSDFEIHKHYEQRQFVEDLFCKALDNISLENNCLLIYKILHNKNYFSAFEFCGTGDKCVNFNASRRKFLTYCISSKDILIDSNFVFKLEHLKILSRTDDFIWIIDELESNSNLVDNGFLLLSVINDSNIESEKLDKLLDILEKYPQKKELFKWMLTPIELNSESAINCRKFYYSNENKKTQKIRKEITLKQFEESISRLLNGSIKAFPVFIINFFLDKNKVYKDEKYEEVVEPVVLLEKHKRNLEVLAKRFLISFSGVKSYEDITLSFAISFSLNILSENNEEFLFPNFIIPLFHELEFSDEKKELFNSRKILMKFYHNFRTEFLSSLESAIVSKSIILENTLNNLNEIANENDILELIFKHLKDNTLAKHDYNPILVRLLNVDFQPAIDFAKEYLESDINGVKAVEIAVALFNYSKSVPFEFLEKFLENDIGFRKKFMFKLAAQSFYKICSNKMIEIASAIKIYKYGVQLLNSHKRKEIRLSVFTPDEYDHLGTYLSGIMTNFCNLKFDEGKDVLVKLSDTLSHDIILRSKRDLIKSNIERIQNQIPAQDLITCIENTKLGIIRDRKDLVAIIIDGLCRIQNDLNNTKFPQFCLLWRGKNSADLQEPKDEDTIGMYVINELNKILIGRGIHCSFNGRLSMKTPNKTGMVPDISVEYELPTSEKINVHIEIKGSWNNEIKTNLKTQLAERYLSLNADRYGIFLVVYFEKHSRIENQNQILEYLQEQARDEEKNNKYIVPFVLSANPQ
jgi:hypothetical protein